MSIGVALVALQTSGCAGTPSPSRSPAIRTHPMANVIGVRVSGELFEEIWEGAQGRCEPLTAWTAEGTLQGLVNGRSTAARVALTWTRHPTTFGLTIFQSDRQTSAIFASDTQRATLLNPARGRVSESNDPGVMLETFIGIRMRPEHLEDAFFGCSADYPRSVGDGLLRVPLQSGTGYMERDAGSWRMTSFFYHDTSAMWAWMVEHSDFIDGLPRSFRFQTPDSARTNFLLRLERFLPVGSARPE